MSLPALVKFRGSMTSAAIFVLVGLVCGFFLRLPAFMTATFVILLIYVIANIGSEASLLKMVAGSLVGLVSLQIGYFAAVLLRIGFTRATARSGGQEPERRDR